MNAVMDDSAARLVAPEAEDRVHSKVAKRLIPFLIICYFVAYLDRVNVGFAALTMNKDLGLSTLDYSFAASIFFIGYFLFEVPSNLLLERFGARRWIARIMITWGLVSAGMAFVSGPVGFYCMRFLLGVAEAGFFPGIILYLSYWFPAEQRGRIVGLFMAAIPISTVLGAPLSGALLGLDGVWGLKGWQWLFILEGLPAAMLGIVTWAYLTDRPESAEWLDEGERNWLRMRMESDAARVKIEPHGNLGKILAQPSILVLSLIYFGVVAANYALGFWLPQIVKAFGFSNLQTGFVAAIPFLCGSIGMVLWGRHSDQTGERVWHLAIATTIAAVGLGACSLTGNPSATMATLSIAAVGIFSAMPAFWATASALVRPGHAAAGIALINSIGNLAGFGGPYLIGWIKDATGDFSIGLLALAMLPALSGVLSLTFVRVKYYRST